VHDYRSRSGAKGLACFQMVHEGDISEDGVARAASEIITYPLAQEMLLPCQE
jgi:hypothetical protein